MEPNVVNTVNNTESEISLRELIEALWRQKWLIVIITAVFCIVGFVVSFFVMESTYESRATLQVSPTNIKEDSMENIDAIVEFYNKFPSMTVETYLEQVTAPQVLQKTIETLDLRGEDGTYITRKSLLGMIAISNTKNTNLIGVTVTNKDPEMAANIANTLGNVYVSFMTENNRKQSDQLAAMLEEQLLAEQQKLDEKAMELANYLASSKSIDVLKNEVDMYISKLNDFKSQVTELEYRVIADRKILAAYDDVAAATMDADASLEIPMSSSGASFNLQVPADGDSIPSMVYALNMAQIQSRLVENTENLTVLTDKIVEITDKLSAAQAQLAQEEYKYQVIQRDKELAQQTFNAYQQRHKEVIVASAAQMSSTNILLSSNAVPSSSPVGPRKMLNMAIAAVLGLMLGVFLAFLLEYWKNSGKKTA
jgi:capsular polysaccharide biosynthesis protein